MKNRNILIYTLCAYTVFMLGCTPAEVDEAGTDRPNVEEPAPVPPPSPDEPETPEEPVIPDDDNGSSGKPGEDESDKYSEESKPIYVAIYDTKSNKPVPDEVPKPNLNFYQMIDADGKDGDNPFVQTWHQDVTGLSSSMFDKENEHDHWLITEGIYINYNKVMLAWTLLAEGQEQYYEVYVSDSRDKESFKELIYSERLKPIKDGSRKVDRILKGYEGKTLYIAFRHKSLINQNFSLTLEDLTVSSFPYDEVDLVTDKMWLTYPKNLKKNTTIPTGTAYMPGINLNVSMVIKNMGIGIRGKDLTLSYEYGGQKKAEVIPNLYLLHGETYVHTFSTQLGTQPEEREITVSVAPLPDEKRIKSNNRYLTMDYVSQDPHYRILFEKISKLKCSWCGVFLHAFEELDEKYPNSLIGITTMYDAGLNVTPNGGLYQGIIGSISYNSGTPSGCYDRTGDAYPSVEKITPIMEEGIFNTRMFPPFAIDVQHDFSEDGSVMYVHLKATCVLDIEDEDYGLTALIVEDNIKEYPDQWSAPKAVHNHIVRAILGDDWKGGVKGIIPANAKAGDIFEHTFEYPVPEKFGKHVTDLTQLYVVGSIIDNLDKQRIINSNKSIKTAALSKKRKR